MSRIPPGRGILGLARAMAAELGRAGITVNAPGPGHILTPINDARFPRIIEERTPLMSPARRSAIAGYPRPRRHMQCTHSTVASLSPVDTVAWPIEVSKYMLSPAVSFRGS